MVRDLATSLSVAFLVIAAVLALVFRSLRAGLVSLIPNVMPLAVGLGFMTLAGIQLQSATVITFSIALGIAVDDTIHFFARYREELQLGETPAAENIKASLSALQSDPASDPYRWSEPTLLPAQLGLSYRENHSS